MLDFLIAIWKVIIDEGRVAIVGGVGAILATYIQRDTFKNKADYFVFFATGWFITAISTQPIIHIFNINKASEIGVSGIIGIIGGALIHTVLKAIRSADLWDFIKQRFGGGR